MKTLEVFYHGYWGTAVDLPDDWEPTDENLRELMDELSGENDFNDGSASWEMRELYDPVTGETIEID